MLIEWNREESRINDELKFNDNAMANAIQYTPHIFAVFLASLYHSWYAEIVISGVKLWFTIQFNVYTIHTYIPIYIHAQHTHTLTN